MSKQSFDMSFYVPEKDYRYNKSYNDGYRAGACNFIINVDCNGDKKGRSFSEKAVKTCRKYASDPSVYENGLGHELTPALRRYYSGMADALEDSIDGFLH